MLNSLPYYEHNAERYAARTGPSLDIAALEAFISHLSSQLSRPSGASILDAGCGSGRDLRYFLSKGFKAEGVEASSKLAEIARKESGAPVRHSDLLFLSMPKESLDGIWANRSLIHLPNEGWRRVLASFFQCTKRGGTLFLSFDEGIGTRDDRQDDPEGPARTFHLQRADDVASLIRQHGFQVVAQGHNLQAPERIGFVARRI